MLIEKSEGFSELKRNIMATGDRLVSLKKELEQAVNRKIADLEKDVANKIDLLENQSPLNNLKKGFALIYKGDIPAKEYSFTAGETAKILTFSQELTCESTETKPRKA